MEEEPVREEKFHIYLNDDEYSRVIQSLIRLKNSLIAQGRNAAETSRPPIPFAVGNLQAVVFFGAIYIACHTLQIVRLIPLQVGEQVDLPCLFNHGGVKLHIAVTCHSNKITSRNEFSRGAFGKENLSAM